MSAWENYGGNQRVRPGSIVKPTDLADICRLVKAAANQGQRIKCVGSGHSFSGVLLCDKGEVLVDVGACNESLKRLCLVEPQLRSAEGAGKHLVAMETSVVVGDLADWLDQQGLGLRTFGAVNGQTMVGAMATGTHGSDLRFGPLSNMTRAFILVDGRGAVRLVQPSAADLLSGAEIAAGAQTQDDNSWLVSALGQATAIADDDLFNACVIGVGVVGIIYAVVLQVEPQYWLHETRSVIGWRELKSQWQLPDRWRQAKATWQAAKQELSGDKLQAARNEWRMAQEDAVRDLAQRLAHVLGDETRPLRTYEFLINPYPTLPNGDHKCSVVRTAPTAAGTSAEAQACPTEIDCFQAMQHAILGAGRTVGLRWGIFRCLYRWFNRVWRLFGLDAAFTQLLVRLFGLIPKSLPDIIDKVLIEHEGERVGPSHRILTRTVYEVKGWGIEVAVALDRLPDALDDVLAKLGDLFRQHRFTTGSIAIRFVAMTNAMLGVSHDETKMMIEPTMLMDTPHGGRILRELQRLVMDRHEGVIHWGLEWDEAVGADTANEFSHLERFRQVLQDTLDPDGRFANAYSRRVGIHA